MVDIVFTLSLVPCEDTDSHQVSQDGLTRFVSCVIFVGQASA